MARADYYSYPVFEKNTLIPNAEWLASKQSTTHTGHRRLAAAIIQGMLTDYGNYKERLKNLLESRFHNPNEIQSLKSTIRSIERIITSPRFLLPYLVDMDQEMMEIGIERMNKK